MTKEEAARVLKNIWTRYISTFDDIESEEVDALDTAIAAPTTNPCDNCIGPALAISHGYSDMRTKTEEAK